MKQLLITIAALVLVGCDSSSKYAGKYFHQKNEGHAKEHMRPFILNEDYTLVYKSEPWVQENIKDTPSPYDRDRKGNWKIEDDFLIIRINGNNEIGDHEYTILKETLIVTKNKNLGFTRR